MFGFGDFTWSPENINSSFGGQLGMRVAAGKGIDALPEAINGMQAFRGKQLLGKALSGQSKDPMADLARYAQMTGDYEPLLKIMEMNRPKPLNAPNVQFNPATGELMVSQYDPNTGQLSINTPQGFGMPTAPMPQDGMPNPTVGMTPKARAEYESGVAKSMAEREAAKPKVMRGYNELSAQTDRMLSAIKDASGQANTATTGYIGEKLGGYAGTSAYNLRNGSNLVLQANNFVKSLQDMRQNSPTGGAVGNVTEQEGAKIQSVIASINPNLGLQEYKKQLANLEKELVASRERVKDAIESEYGSGSSGIQNTQRPQSGGWKIEEVR